MNARANRLANWLQNYGGIGKGDRVAILARDGVEHLDCFFACSKLGALHTALNWRLHWQELVEIFRQTTPRLLIFSADFQANVAHLYQALQNEGLSLKLAHLEGPGIEDSQLFESILQTSEDCTTYL